MGIEDFIIKDSYHHHRQRQIYRTSNHGKVENLRFTFSLQGNTVADHILAIKEIKEKQL